MAAVVSGGMKRRATAYRVPTCSRAARHHNSSRGQEVSVSARQAVSEGTFD